MIKLLSMKYSRMELVTVAVLSLLGLIFLWRIPIINDLPLFLISYLLAIFLPGYTFLTFIKPERLTIKSQAQKGGISDDF